MSWDPYRDLRTGVLHNRLGLTDPAALATAEADFSAARITALALRPLPGGYDLPHLQAFHWHVFGDVYPWAGQVRTVSLGKGRLFCPPGEIEATAAVVFGDLARANHLRGLDRSTFVAALGLLFAQVNALHPFREGNGRTQRAFLSQLARDAGHPVRWAGLEPAENVEASVAAAGGDPEPLRAMLDRLVV
ncbi:Fic family protein [Pseudonocardia ailaonensis]|uniref:protein adenylyltransferase n=1 Tax=Pseudonocardia ailaonensis TaxID=367279 RepID=A0ABN2MMN3_9PSEU